VCIRLLWYFNRQLYWAKFNPWETGHHPWDTGLIFEKWVCCFNNYPVNIHLCVYKWLHVWVRSRIHCWPSDSKCLITELTSILRSKPWCNGWPSRLLADERFSDTRKPSSVWFLLSVMWPWYYAAKFTISKFVGLMSLWVLCRLW